MDDNLWLIELESALLDDCNVNDIYAICRGKAIPEALRPDVWQVCLDVRHKSDQMSLFNEIFDLPFQNTLREDCQVVVDRIGNDDEDKVSVISDLESILTFYCKNRNLQYESDNGWIDLLLPLLALKLNRCDTYNLFESIRDIYIPKGCKPKGNVFHVFRLLILYHDPELCTMLDTKKITPDLYSIQWFQCLFASSCSLSVILSMWDLYFQHADPFMVFFLALIILVNGRDQILAMKNTTKEELLKFLSNMPCALEPDDVVDFCSLAQYYALKTPSSFKTDFLKALYGSQSEKSSRNETCTVSQALCLPVSVYELVENSSIDLTIPDAVRFFLVDCRPADQYNAGHLSTAFHLDCNLMLQEPISFSTAVQGLLTAQRQAIEANSNAGGEHLCFMGSGRMEEDQYTHMVVASFLQKNTQYVSLLTGGYTAIHDYFGDHMADCLEDHDVKKCIVCMKNSVELRNLGQAGQTQQPRRDSQRPTSDIFSRFSAVMKIKSAEVKDKLFDIITNPSNGTSTAVGHHHGGSLSGQTAVPDRHVSANERNGKRYRNVAPVFSIDDDNDDHYKDNELKNSAEMAGSKLPGDAKEIVNLTLYLKSTDIINAFRCQEVHMNGYMYDSHLIITATHLIVLRELGHGQAQIIVRRPLSSIVKITAKKRHRDLITFKYGFPNGDGLLITDMDRFLIPNASEATALVSKHIVQTLDGSKLT
ncbi:TBC1 domain family member 23 [Rhagoletis pomonella]|uniref:TBC1 domain family member 23 n=1 Tax=Rhagoletis pomonella TaxID=28610 RepID=UPI00177CFDC2|nr:TBC1 domain family member 23 [Rhagoletis pomonella]XP_036327710.1 TBC1 domain family member 23 [Rhagoletis pomonella]